MCDDCGDQPLLLTSDVIVIFVQLYAKKYTDLEEYWCEATSTLSRLHLYALLHLVIHRIENIFKKMSRVREKDSIEKRESGFKG